MAQQMRSRYPFTSAALVSAFLPSAIVVAQPTTTILTHGFSPDSKGSWVQEMAAAVIERAGGVGTVYRYTGDTGRWTIVPEAGGDGSSEHVVLIFNWVPESAEPAFGPNWNYVQAAGDALAAMLRDPVYAEGGPASLVEGRTTHLIGHSRGACVISEAIRRLALAPGGGIPVDQMTTLDPHPVNGTLDSRYDLEWGDPVPVRWSNVAWADNYWRADGGGILNGLDFDGIPLVNTFGTQLNEGSLNCCAYFFAHLDVHLWYHGTIDTSADAGDGEEDITPTMRSTWWPQGYTEKGFFYSGLGGGAAQRPAIPAGVDPEKGSAPLIYNGDFENGTYAGWWAHGGGGANVVNISGDWVNRLTAGAPMATHNVAYLPNEMLEVSMEIRRVGAGSTDDVVGLALQRAEDRSPVILPGAMWEVGSLGGAFVKVTAMVPVEFRGRTSRLSIVLDGGRNGVNSTVDVDDIAVSVVPGPAADVNGDGVVNGADLGLVLSAWGMCAGCPEDLNGDDAVDGADLGVLLSQWTN